MKKIPLVFMLSIFSFILFSQEVISPAGKTQLNSGYEVSWTVGEPSIKTLSGGEHKLTQGFHQPKLTITSIDETSVSENEVTVYPNPTNEFAIVSFNQPPEKHSFRLFDLSGRLLKTGRINSNETKINLTQCSEGSYLLKIFYENDRPLQTFKIVKQ